MLWANSRLRSISSLQGKKNEFPNSGKRRKIIAFSPQYHSSDLCEHRSPLSASQPGPTCLIARRFSGPGLRCSERPVGRGPSLGTGAQGREEPPGGEPRGCHAGAFPAQGGRPRNLHSTRPSWPCRQGFPRTPSAVSALPLDAITPSSISPLPISASWGASNPVDGASSRSTVPILSTVCTAAMGSCGCHPLPL